MKTQDAKKIPITEVLSKLGLQPVKKFKAGVELGYLSPFRGEKEPSFFVNIQKNVWYDFAENGGNLLDFIMKYKNTNLRGALKFLDDLYENTKYTLLTKNIDKISEIKPETTQTLHIDKIISFGLDSMLANYILKERRINPDVAQKYLKEIHFTNTETQKKYFAVGFANISGGFEIRNPYFKSSVGQKDISYISVNSKTILIFEGFINFLSFLTFKKQLETEADVIILNTLSYINKAIKLIKDKEYLVVEGYLDNDKSGNEKTELLLSELKSIYKDQRPIFKHYKDFNEFIKYEITYTQV